MTIHAFRSSFKRARECLSKPTVLCMPPGIAALTFYCFPSPTNRTVTRRRKLNVSKTSHRYYHLPLPAQGFQRFGVHGGKDALLLYRCQAESFARRWRFLSGRYFRGSFTQYPPLTNNLGIKLFLARVESHWRETLARLAARVSGCQPPR